MTVYCYTILCRVEENNAFRYFIDNVCIYTPYSPASSGLSSHYGCLEIAGLLMSCREYGIFAPFSKVSVYRVDDVFEQGLHISFE